jgi:hypothetical protein
MADEKTVYTESDDSGTWAVVELALGTIIVAVALYFGGVLGQTAVAHEPQSTPAVDRWALESRR